MDSFEFNKIAGAVLGTAVFIMLAGWLTETIFHTEAPETPVYLASLATGEGGDHGMGGDVPQPELSIAALMVTADAGKGESIAKKCAACHTFEQGGANKVGPNLWNVVNKPIASVDGFSYSESMVAFSGGKVWDYETLDHFVAKPKALVDGTKMTFGGLSKAADRADLIAYLRSLSDSPAPLPEAPAGDSADAGGAATETASAEPMQETATDATEASGGTEMTAPAGGESASAMTEQPAESASETTAPESSGTEMAAAGSETPAASAGSGSDNPVLAMIAGEDPADGQKVAKKCAACHSFEEGGKAKVGPPLWNIVNRPVASIDGFKYSDAMKAHADGGTVWSYEELEAYLVKPKEYIPGNKMVFAGLRKEEDRAALLAYLRTLASEPAPLP